MGNTSNISNVPNGRWWRDWKFWSFATAHVILIGGVILWLGVYYGKTSVERTMLMEKFEDVAEDVEKITHTIGAMDDRQRKIQSDVDKLKTAINMMKPGSMPGAGFNFQEEW